MRTYGRRTLVIESFGLLQNFKEFALWSKLEDQIDLFWSILVVKEVTIQAKNVSMPKIGLDFDFASQLVLNIVFDEL